MPTAVAAQPAQTIAAPSPADAASISSVDFAALLLGQFTADGRGDVLPVADTAATPLPADPTASAPQDPALLLAAIGYAASLPGNAPAGATASLPAETRTAVVSDTDNATRLPALSAAGTQPPARPAEAVPEELAPAAVSVGKESPQPQATTSAAPAKTAGFEQKLAEAGTGKVETPPAPQVLSGTLPGSGATAVGAAKDVVRVDTPLKDNAWPAEFGQKVVWLATHDKQSAQITLNPPQLGPIEISLHVKSDQATAVFSSANADVREAIETALPRLREMLAGVGVELGQANVNAESFRQPADGGSNRSDTGRDRGPADGDVGGGRNAIRAGSMAGGGSRHGSGLVDTFA